MRVLNLSLLIVLLIFSVSCSNSSQENDVTREIQITDATEAEVEVKKPANSIWVSAKKGDIESIRQHIAFGTDLNSVGSSRDETALIIAACQGHVEVVDLLVKEGVDLNIQNNEGVTAQFCAVFFGRTEIVQILSDAGADPNIVMSQDLTAMDLVSVEWGDTRESAVRLYKLKYQVSFGVDEIKAEHPLIMEILNK